jgi:hypothetical protein
MAEKDNTQVVEVDSDIATLLAQPGADSVMTASSTNNEGGDGKKPSIFQRKVTDLSFLDKPASQTTGKTQEEIDAEKKLADEKAKADAEAKKAEGIKNGTLNPDGTPKVPTTVDDLDEIANLGGGEEDADKKAGRPKLDKDGLYEMTKKLIEQKKLIPFDDDKPLEKYTLADYEELYEANDAAKSQKLEKEIPVKFFDSLPDKLKSAAAYVANGGQDLKGMFRALAEVEEVADLDPDTESGQEQITRQYLQSTKFGTAEEIQEQLNEWKDQGVLDKKANQFKPKLDALQESYVAYKLQEAETQRKQQQEQANHYMKNVYEVLEPGELNGIKLDKKTQGMLYSGLVQPNYPSISGKQTNLLGHLLEKYQWVEPNHGLIAEALYLLADPEGYKAKLREGGKKEAVAATARALKTEEGKKIASTVSSEEDDERKKEFRLPRPSGSSFFKR